MKTQEDDRIFQLLTKIQDGIDEMNRMVELYALESEINSPELDRMIDSLTL